MSDHLHDATPEQLAHQLQAIVHSLEQQGRTDLLLQAIGVPLLEQLRIEAARGHLVPMTITRDFRFLLHLPGGLREVELQPVHKAVYLLFLNHPEGIEFKRLADYRQELLSYYLRLARPIDKEKALESVDHLVNPLDNSINEKCARIKHAFMQLLDEYSASYYIISSHATQHLNGSSRLWNKRLKVITLPRELLLLEDIKK